MFLRYLVWSYDPDEQDPTCVTDYVYLLREGADQVWVEHDGHIEGLFGRAEWLKWLGEAGFETRIVIDPYERDLFITIKPE